LPAGVAEGFGRHEAEPPGGAEHEDAAFHSVAFMGQCSRLRSAPI
jgi:hypothetical protein